MKKENSIIGKEVESRNSFALSFGNSIPATYTCSWNGTKDFNENFILKVKRPRSWFGKVTLNYDKGKIQINHKESSKIYRIYNRKDDLYATMQFLTKNKVEITTHGETYYGNKKSKHIEIIDKNRNVCISFPATFTYSRIHRNDFPISSSGSLSPELVSLIVYGLIVWYEGFHAGMREKFEDPNSFSFKIKRKGSLGGDFIVYNSNDEEVMNIKSGGQQLFTLGFLLLIFCVGVFILAYLFITSHRKFILKSIDGLDLGQLTRNISGSKFKITDLTTNNELDFSRGKHLNNEFTSSNEEFYSLMNSVIYDSRDNEIFSIYGLNTSDFKIYREEHHLSEVSIILISIALIQTNRISFSADYYRKLNYSNGIRTF